MNNSIEIDPARSGAEIWRNIMRDLKPYQHGWSIDGRTMTWAEWLDELAPGDDNPLRTWLTLKYQK